MEKCKLCGSENVNIIRKIKSPYFDMFFSLYECKNCFSRFFDDKENNVSINDMYEMLADDTKENFEEEFKENRFWRHQKNKIFKLMNGKINNILDIGCRTGDFLMHFPENVKRSGVELSARQAEIAKKRGLNIFCDSVENLVLEEKYDVITCYAILEHLINPNSFLQKIPELLKDNGLFVISIPTHECFKEKLLYSLNIRWHMYSPPEHLNFYSDIYLKRFFKENNFKIISKEYLSGGLFNPFKNIYLLNRVFDKMMFFYDKSYFNRIPVFDHKVIFLRK